MIIPSVPDNIIESHIVKRLVNPSDYYSPSGLAVDPYCPGAEEKWLVGLSPRNILRVSLMVLAASDLTSGKLHGIQSTPILTPAIYKSTESGEPTGLTLNENGIFLVSPPFPFVNEDLKPQFLNWPRTNTSKDAFQALFDWAVKEFGILYALIARKGNFKGPDDGLIKGYFDMKYR